MTSPANFARPYREAIADDKGGAAAAAEAFDTYQVLGDERGAARAHRRRLCPAGGPALGRLEARPSYNAVVARAARGSRR